MGKPNPAASLAQRMVAFLEARRETGPAEYMLPRQDLVDETRDGADDATVKKALGSKEFKAHVVLANANDPAAPAALQEDLQTFAESASLLNYLKSRAPSANGQPHLVNDLKKGIAGGGKAAELKKAFDEAVRRRIAEGAVSDVLPKKPSKTELTKRRAEALGENMIKCLESRREAGSAEYMLRLQDLVDETRDEADEATINKALTSSRFNDRVVAANAKDRASPVALAEDLEAFARSLTLLEYLKSQAPRFDGQPYLIDDLKKGIVGRGKAGDLRKAFDAAIREKVAAGSLPDVAPKKLTQADLAGRLADDLVKVLDSQRRLGDGSYPLSLRKLAELADARDEKIVAKAISSKAFANRVLVAWSKDLNAPVAFPEDADKLARRPELLPYALRAAREKKKHAHTVAKLAVKLSGGHDNRLQSAFKIEIARRCDQDTLPSGVGAIMDSDWKLFFLEDMLPASERRRTGAKRSETPPVAVNRHDGDGRHAPAQRPAPTAPDASNVSRPAGSSTQVASPPYAEFARRFEKAFSRLDRQHGGHNFVSLAEMRRQLEAFPRAEFDRHLRQLRVEQRFTLSGAQSKQGLSEEVREAGILEAGHLLTYVSRRN